MPQIDLEIAGSFGDLFPNLRQLISSMETLDKTNTRAIQSMNKGLSDSAKGIADVNSSLEKTTSEAAANAQKIGETFSNLGGLKTFSTDGKQAMQAVSAEVERIINQFSTLGDATIVAAQQFTQGETTKQVQLRAEIDQLQKLQEALRNANNTTDAQRLGAQIGITSRTVQKLALDIKDAKAQNDQLGNSQGAPKLEQKFESLRTKINLARSAAFGMMEQFGENSPQAISAQTELALLEKKLSDLQRRVEAFNPEKKFAAIGQLAQGIAGAFAAAQGALALFGTKSEEVDNALKKAFAGLSIASGINELSRLPETFKTISVILGFNTVAAEENSAAKATNVVADEAVVVAEGEAAAAKGVDTVVTEGLTVAEGEAAVATGVLAGATRLLTVAVDTLLGPVGLVIAAVAAGIGVYEAFSDGTKKTSEQVDEFIKSLENLAKEQALINDLTKAVTTDRISILKAQQEQELSTLQTTQGKKLSLIQQEHDAQLAAAISTSSTKEEIARAEINVKDLQQQFDLQAIKEKQAADKELFALELSQQKELQQAKAAQVNQNIALDEQEKQKLILTNEKLNTVLADADENQKKAIQQQIDGNNEKVEQLIFDQRKLRSSINSLDAEGAKEELKISQDASKALLDDKTKLRDELLKVQQDLFTGLKELADKSNAAQLTLLTGQAKIDFDKKATDDSINNLQSSLVEKEQAVARSNAVIAGLSKQETEAVVSQVKLTADQEKELNSLRFAANKKYFDDTFKLAQDNQKKIIELTERGDQQKRDLLEIALNAQAKELRDSGQSEEDIIKATNLARLEGLTKISIDRINLQADTDKKIIDQIKIAGVQEEQAQRIRDAKKLQVDIDAAKQALAVKADEKNNDIFLGVDTTQVNNDIQTLLGLIAALESKLKIKFDEIKKNSQGAITKLLNIKPEDLQKFEQAAGTLVDNLDSIANEVIRSQKMILDAQVTQNEELINSLKQRVSDTESALNDELALQKKGYANNVDAKRQQLALLKAEEDKALLQQQALTEKKKKLAKEQAVADAIATSAKLILTAVQVVETATSEGGWVGAILGIAEAAAIVAEFITISNNIKAASLGEKGGTISGGTVKGKSHADGGVKYYSDKGVVELEDGEEVTNKKQSARHRTLLKAINNEDYNSVDLHELMPFLKTQNIILTHETVNAISDPILQNHTVVQKLEVTNNMRMNKLENHVADFKQMVANHFGDRSSEETRTDGSRVITTAHKTKIITGA